MILIENKFVIVRDIKILKKAYMNWQKKKYYYQEKIGCKTRH